MLILTRKESQSIVLDGDIEITVLEVADGKVKIGIQAPDSVRIHRKEVYEAIIQENREASSATINILDQL